MPSPAVYEAHDWTQPHVADDALQPVFERIYQDTDRYWREYALCEDLVDLETAFQLWRFRHMRTVMRVIGFKRGTGGSSGVGFLAKALELTFFPELFQVRTSLQAAPPQRWTDPHSAWSRPLAGSFQMQVQRAGRHLPQTACI